MSITSMPSVDLLGGRFGPILGSRQLQIRVALDGTLHGARSAACRQWPWGPISQPNDQ
jgi:hypothetical protein